MKKKGEPSWSKAAKQSTFDHKAQIYILPWLAAQRGMDRGRGQRQIGTFRKQETRGNPMN